jgi:SMI1/KNR4 family protein SUKH-1
MEWIYRDGGRRTTQLMRDSLGGGRLTMDLADYLAHCPDTWRPAAPASSSAISSLVSSAPIDLPQSYLALLKFSDGGEGDLSVEPGWIALWPASSVASLNAQYEVSTHAPGLWGFASNGGGELLAFDLRSGPPYSIVTIPFISMAVSSAKIIAPSFDALVGSIGTRLPAA